MSAPGRRWQATLIVVLFFLAVAAAAFTGWWYARESPPHQGPIVLISADGLSAGTLRIYGGGTTPAPALEALAADGVVFDRAYAHTPATLPANASILSGQLPFEHGVRDDAGFALGDETRTLAELLRNRGFNTGAAVSTFLLRRASGVGQGFAFFDAELPAAGGDETAAPTTREASATVEAAEEWIRQQDGQRFMLFVQVAGDEADAAVTRLLDELRARDLYDPATIVFVGDHGAGDESAPLSDGMLRVPLIVKQPASGGAGRRVAIPVQQIDLLPTILDLVRAPVPSGVRGRSLRPVLDDEDGTVAAQPIYAESLTARYRLGGAPHYALTAGTRRLITGDPDAVFDLERGGDALPAETSDAVALREQLDRLLDARTLPRPSLVTASEEAPLSTLGYLPLPSLLPPTPVVLTGRTEASLLATQRAAANLLAQQKVAAAIERLRTMTRGRPELAVVHYQTGWLLLRLGRTADATAAFRDAARLQPDNADIAVALAAAALRARDYDMAAAQADAAIAIAGQYQPDARAAANTLAARIAILRADATAAVAYAEAAQAAGAPTVADFVRGRVALAEGRDDDALEALQAAAATVTSARPFEDLYIALGDVLARLERYDDAERQYREELVHFPRSATAYTRLAMLHASANRTDGVEQVLGELLQAAPTPEGYAAAARVWTTLGERARADGLRTEARARFRGDPSLALLDRP